jgi:predicted acetyltransferase
MKILKAADAFDKSAKIYQNKFMDVSLYAEPFKLFFDNINLDNASILDIACGPETSPNTYWTKDLILMF